MVFGKGIEWNDGVGLEGRRRRSSDESVRKIECLRDRVLIYIVGIATVVAAGRCTSVIHLFAYLIIDYRE